MAEVSQNQATTSLDSKTVTFLKNEGYTVESIQPGKIKKTNQNVVVITMRDSKGQEVVAYLPEGLSKDQTHELLTSDFIKFRSAITGEGSTGLISIDLINPGKELLSSTTMPGSDRQQAQREVQANNIHQRQTETTNNSNRQTTAGSWQKLSDRLNQLIEDQEISADLAKLVYSKYTSTGADKISDAQARLAVACMLEFGAPAVAAFKSAGYSALEKNGMVDQVWFKPSYIKAFAK